MALPWCGRKGGRIMTNNTPVSATGWIAENWPAFVTEGRPPVIVNPEASTGALLAWCFGEVRSLNAAALAVSATLDESLSADEVMLIFAHRLGPLETVMREAVSQLASAQSSTGAKAAGSCA